MDGMATQLLAVLLELKPLCSARLLRRPVVPLSRIATLQPDVFTYHITTSDKKPASRPAGGRVGRAHACLRTDLYSRILVTTPDPTVLPPSRMANRLPSCMAIGCCSSTSSATLSPGMHISAPPISFVVPVTSVVRK